MGRCSLPPIGHTAKRRPRRPSGLDLSFRFCLIVFEFNQNLKKANPKNEQPEQAQARTETMAVTAATNARRLDSHTT